MSTIKVKVTEHFYRSNVASNPPSNALLSAASIFIDMPKELIRSTFSIGVTIKVKVTEHFYRSNVASNPPSNALLSAASIFIDMPKELIRSTFSIGV